MLQTCAEYNIIISSKIFRGKNNMKSVKILLNTTDSVKSFVNIISSFDYDADIRSGRYVVNAKSILGIFSLELSRPVVLEIYENDCDDLLEQLSEFMVK